MDDLYSFLFLPLLLHLCLPTELVVRYGTYVRDPGYEFANVIAL
jgi:hypothetical protein